VIKRPLPATKKTVPALIRTTASRAAAERLGKSKGQTLIMCDGKLGNADSCAGRIGLDIFFIEFQAETNGETQR
jgi:hypothetical protein